MASHSPPPIPRLPSWLWSFVWVLPISHATMAVPIPFEAARQRLIDAAATPWMVDRWIAGQRQPYRYAVTVAGDTIIIDGPHGWRVSPLLTQGMLSPAPDGCTLWLESTLLGRHPVRGMGMVIAIVALVGAWIFRDSVVGPGPQWLGPVIGALLSSSLLVTLSSVLGFTVKYEARFIRDQCVRTIEGMPRVTTR